MRKSGSSVARARNWSRSVCLASSSWLSAAGGAVHDSLQVARPGATHSEIAVGRVDDGCWKFNLGRQKFTDGFACKLFC